MYKRNNSDLIVGGVIFISLFILITGVLWLKGTSVNKNKVSYFIRFKNIGTLQKGDPVTVNGVKKGNVKDIKLNGSYVDVEIKLEDNIKLTDSSRIIIQNIGLMGERMVGIQLSEKGNVYKPYNKDNPIKGYFDSGIAEAMGMMGNVLQRVMNMIDTLNEIINYTVGDTVFKEQFKNIFARIDTISYLAQRILKDNKTGINNSIKNVELATNQLNRLIEQNKTNINTITENTAQITEDGLHLTAQTDSLLITVNNMIDYINNGQGTIGKLVKDEITSENINRSLTELDSLLRDIETNGLKLRAKIWGNRKYFKNKEK